MKKNNNKSIQRNLLHEKTHKEAEEKRYGSKKGKRGARLKKEDAFDEGESEGKIIEVFMGEGKLLLLRDKGQEAKVFVMGEDKVKDLQTLTLQFTGKFKVNKFPKIEVEVKVETEM